VPTVSVTQLLPPDQPDPASSPTGSGPVVYLGQFDGGPGQSLTEPTGLALDTHDNLYVIDAATSRIVKFDPNGNVLTTWGTPGTGDGQFDFLSHTPGTQGGLTVDADDIVYVVDSSGTVQRFDSDGRFLGRWPGGGRGTGAGQFDMTGGIGRDPQGNLYLTDLSFTSSVNNRVQKFSPQGVLLASWGSKGDAAGQFALPAGVAFGPSGEMYVADYYNHRVQVLDAQGHFLRQWGTWGNGPGQFDRPFSLALDAKCDVYVSDMYQNRVEKFDSQGNFLGEWGSRGSGPGRFNASAGIAIDSYGDIYVADVMNLRIQKFRPR
jgi:DNA-binding beta-propeller fold protein YncE